MADYTVHDTIPCPPPFEDEQDEQQRLEHLSELIELYGRANAGALRGEPNVTTINGVRIPLAQEAA
jgi:adenosylmethionine-8-amino-7-oxononanoate aminotransferase